jgi:argininosuccinate lyase
MAHVIMLHEVKLITGDDRHNLLSELHSLYIKASNNELLIEEGVEDIHSQVESMLSDSLGVTGKKVHTGRSRNDQVLLDIRLFTRSEIDKLAGKVHRLFGRLQSLSEQYREYLLPGYTHMQSAMVSSFGLWFGSFAEALTDDLFLLKGARALNNRNPLGTAAGYGTTLPINRKLTMDLLGFDELVYNSAYASINRGKVEMAIAAAIASLANTLSRMSMDICLYMSTEFRFIGFPDELVTGSSIMPQKKNPDVFEIIRAKSNELQSLPGRISHLTSNLPTGYNRDMQLLKSMIFNAFTTIGECVEILVFMLGGIKIRKNITESPEYNLIFSTEEVNRLVKDGIPFRDAYKAVSGMLKNGSFSRTQPSDYTHEGSIGNLCNKEIKEKEEELIKSFSNVSSQEIEKRLMTFL